ncbi:MAG: GatB/YqeY domain-containing protein [Desulfobacterales bacterium]|nr:GatB/YqeY domain-containing protein [Desulfobacterales bacterium]MDJ0915474.1 GatB/YqeY domain-containing protein [Desulfobacterales bacterium]
MTLQERIKKDLVAAMKAKDEDKKSALRVILGEFGRQAKKGLSDDDVSKILRKLIKSEKEVIVQQGDSAESPFIAILENYLPQMATDDDIKSWIAENIDFSQFKNNMQAMGAIMKHFGGTADGNRVRQILQNF